MLVVQELLIPAVAILVIPLAVVKLLIIPCFRVSRGQRLARVFTGVGAYVFAIAAVILGMEVCTMWVLYDGGHGRPPTLTQWLELAAINAILAAVAGLLGGALGLGIGLAIEGLVERMTKVHESVQPMIRKYHRLGLYWSLSGLLLQIPIWFVVMVMWSYIMLLTCGQWGYFNEPHPPWGLFVVCWLPASVPLLIGLAYSAKAKGRNPAWCLFGLLSLIGFIVLRFLSDQSAAGITSC